MKNLLKLVLIIIAGIIMSQFTAPEGLTQEAWIFFSLFVCVFIGLIIEPFPSAFLVLLGVVVACILKIGPKLTIGFAHGAAS